MSIQVGRYGVTKEIIGRAYVQIFWSSDLENKAMADIEYSEGSALVEKMGMTVAMCVSG
jgi:hypothetical protein